MKYLKLLPFLFLSMVIFSNNIDMRDEAIEARIMPLGNACMQGEDCGISTSGPGYKVSLVKTASPSEPAASGSENEHIVKMLNAGADGVMVFEPAALKIKKGDTIMIVEAMKTMNHVPSTHDGVVKEICVDDGQPVEFGQTIIILE